MDYKQLRKMLHDGGLVKGETILEALTIGKKHLFIPAIYEQSLKLISERVHYDSFSEQDRIYLIADEFMNKSNNFAADLMDLAKGAKIKYPAHATGGLVGG